MANKRHKPEEIVQKLRQGDVLVDALRRDRVKTLALRRQVGQQRGALETGEEPKRQDANKHPGDTPGKGSAHDLSC